MLSQIYRNIEMLIHPRQALRAHKLRKSGILPHDFYAYNQPWLFTRNFNIVLDIGAARGTHTLLFRYLFPDAKIIAFEPLPESFALLTRRTQGQPNIECHKFALSNQEGDMDFHLGGQGYTNSSSLLPMGATHMKLWPGSGTEQCIKVQTRCLDSLIKIKSNDRIFMKMDVQGGELMVIEGGEKVLSAVDTVVVEASMQSLYTGGSTFHELYEKMHSMGFVYAGIIEQAFSPDGSGEVIQNDVIFRRKTSLNL